MELRVTIYELRIWGCEFFARLYYDGVWCEFLRLFLYVLIIVHLLGASVG